jgi:hypothetical protein
MPDPAGPVTLGDLIREDKLLWVYCRECCHERWEQDQVLQLRLKEHHYGAGTLSRWRGRDAASVPRNPPTG